MPSIGIIPARYASTRFPGKPLADILGKTMIQRVLEQAKSSRLNEVVVATDDERIFRHVRDVGGLAVMTAAKHRTGTDRVAEVAAREEYTQFDIVVNIQGDEPFIQPAQINQVLQLLESPSELSIATLVQKIETREALLSPHVVKAVFNQHLEALYFSRSPIPYPGLLAESAWLEGMTFHRHIGLYAFRRSVLPRLASLPPGRLEVCESLEQLRWLENGFRIVLGLTEHESFGIDTPQDLEALIRRIREPNRKL
jgi:3-deoxy-manno-octulosonate cytidylyltransferase (CMP-KDO synthetase)